MVISTDNLPTELIAQIFVEAVKSTRADRRSVDSGTLQALLSVCWRWYDIACDTPELWRTITVHLDNIIDAASEATYKADLDARVRRAKGSLALNVSVTRAPNSHHASTWTEVRRLVGSVCKDLTIYVVNDDVLLGCAPDIAACLDQVAPVLEVLNLDYNTRLPEGNQWTLPRAQNLRKLVWNTDTTVFRFPDDIESFPLLQVVDICIMGYAWYDHTGQVAQIFSRCPNLVTLELDVDLHLSPPVHIESRSLRQLVIREAGSGLVPVLLSALRLPALEKATIDSIRGSYLRGLFSGPLATVRSLEIGSGVAIDNALATCLLHCPQLRHLHLNIDEEDDDYGHFEEFLELMSSPLAVTKDWIRPRLVWLRVSDLDLERGDSLSQTIFTFAQNRTKHTELSRDGETFSGPPKRLTRLCIPTPYWRRGDSSAYRSLRTALEGLGLAASRTRKSRT